MTVYENGFKMAILNFTSVHSFKI